MKRSNNSILLLMTISLNMLFGYHKKLLVTNIFKSCQGRTGCNVLFSSVSSKTTSSSTTDNLLSSQTQANEYLFGVEPSLFSQIPSIHPMISKALSLISRDYATLIQQKALPQLLENNDVVISSETGSGKTLTYLIPLFQKSLEDALALISNVSNENIVTDNNDVDGFMSSSSLSKYPQAVVLVPNKDLAAQVVNMSKTFSDALFSVSNIQITVGSLTRNVGNDRWPYAHSGNCPNILVCTPVMISNFVRGPIVTDEELFKNIKQIVFDEADMLVEGSYLIETEKILEALKKTRREMIRKKEIPVHRRVCQFILSAATLPSSGKYSVSSYVKKTFPNATMVRNEHVHCLHPKITQEFIKVHGMTSVQGAWSDARVKLLVRAIIGSTQYNSSDTNNNSSNNMTAELTGIAKDDDNNDSNQQSTITTNDNNDNNNNNDNDNTTDSIKKENDNDNWSIDELFSDGTTSTSNHQSTHPNYNNNNNDDDVIIITPEIYAQIPHTMVFANEVETVKKLAMKLNQYGLKTVEFHKALQPSLKEMYLQLFQEGVNKVMVCTDSASRGLDLPYVQHVVQAEFATNVVQYLHRVGRCSRAGKQGRATNFYDTASEDLVNTILDDSIGSGSGRSNRYGIDDDDDDDLEVEEEGGGLEMHTGDVEGVVSINEKKNENKNENGDDDDEVVVSNKLISTVVKKNITISTVVSTPSVTQAFSRRRGLRQKFKRALKEQEENQGGAQGSVDEFMNDIEDGHNDDDNRSSNNNNNNSNHLEPKNKNYGDYDDSNYDARNKKKDKSFGSRRPKSTAVTTATGDSSGSAGSGTRREYHSSSQSQSSPVSDSSTQPPARPAASWSKSANTNRDTTTTTTRYSSSSSSSSSRIPSSSSSSPSTNNDAKMYDWENF